MFLDQDTPSTDSPVSNTSASPDDANQAAAPANPVPEEGTAQPPTSAAGQGPATGSTTDPLAALQAELEKARHEAEEYKNLLQHERADFINFKRRVEEEKKDTISFGQGMMLLKILPLYDQFERAFTHVNEDLKDHEWVKGMLGIKALFEKTFQDLKIEKIQAVGQKFDSNFHEAMMHVPGEKDMVISEFEAGYLFQGKVITPARVSVGNGNTVSAQEEKTENEIGENPQKGPDEESNKNP